MRHRPSGSPIPTSGAPFRRLALAGTAAGTMTSIAVAVGSGIDPVVQAGVAIAAVAVFRGVTALTTRLRGEQSLTYYHHEIAILLAAAVVTAVAGAPVLAHLDATALGLGVVLTFGRLGCRHAGCCHGRPAGWGIVYRDTDPAPALPPYLRGLRLVPTQYLEAGTAAVLVVGGLVALEPAAPGRGLAVYVTGYALARPILEHLRGDWQRPYWRGLSEAQWTSLALVVAGAGAVAAGWLPGGWWTYAPLVIAPELALLAAARRRRRPGLLDPAHVAEIVHACRLPAQTMPPRVLLTSLGIRLSRGVTLDAEHISLSRPDPDLTADEARLLAEVVAHNCLHDRAPELAGGPTGVIHLVSRKPHPRTVPI